MGAFLGAYIGILLAWRGSPGLVIGGVIGWFIGAYILTYLAKTFWRSKPHYVMSLRTASSAKFGLVIGAFAGGFLSEVIGISSRIGILSGMAAGLLIGGYLGNASTRAALEAEHLRAVQEEQPSLNENQ